MSDDYDVGYGKPPRNHQFQKGRSGNPRGRPRKDKNPKVWNIDDLRLKILAIGNHPVNVMIDGEKVPMPTILAIYTQLYKKALAGDMRAIREIIKLIPILFREEADAQLKFWQMIADAEDTRKEADEKMTPYEREFVRYERFKNKVGYRKLMGLERAPFEVDEPIDERDWLAYEKHMDDLKEGRPTQWPPMYWDDEDPGSGNASA